MVEDHSLNAWGQSSELSPSGGRSGWLFHTRQQGWWVPYPWPGHNALSRWGVLPRSRRSGWQHLLVHHTLLRWHSAWMCWYTLGVALQSQYGWLTASSWLLERHWCSQKLSWNWSGTEWKFWTIGWPVPAGGGLLPRWQWIPSSYNTGQRWSSCHHHSRGCDWSKDKVRQSSTRLGWSQLFHHIHQDIWCLSRWYLN